MCLYITVGAVVVVLVLIIIGIITIGIIVLYCLKNKQHRKDDHDE